MGLLSAVSERLGRRGAAPRRQRPALIEDPWDHYPELQPVRSALQAGDWPAVRSLLRRYDHPDDRAYVGHRICTFDDVEALLSAVVAADPTDLDAKALLGARTVVLGWRIRGNGLANTVTRERFDAFHEHIRRADAMFTDVVAHDPGNVHAAAWRVTAARALSMGQNEIRRRYTQFASHTPHCWDVQQQVLQGVLPKWGGGWKGAQHFAVDAVRNAPAGSHCGTLIPDFHAEKWVDGTAAEQQSYWTQHSVRVDLASAADRSVLHPDYRPGLSWVGTHHTFAMAFSLAGDWRRAAELYDRLADRFADRAWSYWDDPAGAFLEWRDRTYREVGR